jgi:hypothetical protein
VDNSKKWPVSSELQDTIGVGPEASHNDFLALGFTEEPGNNLLVDNTDSLLVFLYKGVWRALGTNGF